MFAYPHLLDNNSNAFNGDERSDQVTSGKGVVDIDGFIYLGNDVSTLDVKVHEAKHQMLLWNK